MLFKNESDMYKPVIQMMEADGWEVYTEVQVSAYGSRADLVGRRNNILWVVELKRAFTLSVIEQAFNWTNHAHYASVAVPKSQNLKRRKVRDFAVKVCRDHGLGVLLVGEENVRTEQPPSLFRHRQGECEKLREALCEPRRTTADKGNNGGFVYTPFRETIRKLKILLKANPGITMKEAVEGISHHYISEQSARSSLSTWIRRGEISGIRSRGRPLRLYLTKEKSCV